MFTNQGKADNFAGGTIRDKMVTNGEIIVSQFDSGAPVNFLSAKYYHERILKLSARRWSQGQDRNETIGLVLGNIEKPRKCEEACRKFYDCER